jgi:hypothetical protein
MRGRLRPASPEPLSCQLLDGPAHSTGNPVRDRRRGTIVKPFPVGRIALALALVDRAALVRAELLKAPAEADQPERAFAIRIPAAICHDAASAFARWIQRMNSPRGSTGVRSNAWRDFASTLSWVLHCRIQNSVGPYAWRPPLKDCHSLFWCDALSRRRTIEGRRCVKSHAVPFCLQPVQMFGPLIPRYRASSPAEWSSCCGRPIGRSFVRCLAVPLQGGVEAADQGFASEGFCQETDRSRLQRSRTRVVDGERRHENERQAVSIG